MKDQPIAEQADHPKASASVSPRAIFWSVVLIVVVGGALTIGTLSKGTQTPSEALLLSVLLTFFSIGAGWLISHTFYQEDRRRQIQAVRKEYEDNLEVYAVKASEKVINLSNQLARVIDYLGGELASGVSPEHTLSLLKERSGAAVHMLGTLKSMNDTSLSDWEGVIGDRLDAKRKIDEQRNYDINELIEELKLSSRSETDLASPNALVEVVKELKRLSNFEASLPAARRGGMKELECPICKSGIRLRTNAKGKIRKSAATCASCKSQLAIIDGASASPRLEKRERKAEAVSCASCGSVAAVMLDNAVPSQASFRCDGCSEHNLAQRTHGGVTAKLIDAKEAPASAPVDDALIDQVEMLLPDQPWPTGVHHEIAAKLGVRPTTVGKAIQLLIKDGRVKDQVNGVVVEGSEQRPPAQTDVTPGS